MSDQRSSVSRYLVQAGWDDVPHLSEQAKKEIIASTLPSLRDARTRGIPAMGAGAVYPIDEKDILVAPFRIPDWWPRVAGMDVGWRATAVVWMAHDRDNDVLYLITEYKRGTAEPAVHASAIKARGAWVPIMIDPSARGRSQIDGLSLLEMYSDLGLNVIPADNAVEAGLFAVWERMTTQRFKVFSTCREWLAEFRLYRRDTKGKIVKEFDHLMDATRYAVHGGLQHARIKPIERSARAAVGAAIADVKAGY